MFQELSGRPATLTTVELAVVGPLARFAEVDAAAHYKRGRRMTTDQLAAVLDQLAGFPVH